MSNIDVLASHLVAQGSAGKMPARSNGIASSEKSDFLLHLATPKSPAKTAAPAATDGHITAAAESGADLPAAIEKVAPQAAIFLAAAPPSGQHGNVKTARPVKKEPVTGAPTAKPAPAAPALAVPAALAPPAANLAPASGTAAPAAPQPVLETPSEKTAIAAAGQIVGQTDTQPQPAIKQPAQAETARKISADLPKQSSQAIPAAPTVPSAPSALQAAIIAAPATAASPVTASHKAAFSAPTSHGNGITAQLALALPNAAVKTGNGFALHVMLKPETLGAISIKVQHGSADNTNVTITASQPETLETLKKDAADLNQILTNAGIPEAGRQLDFRAEPVVASQSSAGTGNAASFSMQNNSDGRQTPQHGMGFAAPSPSAAAPASNSAAVTIMATPAVPATPAIGVDMIA